MIVFPNAKINLGLHVVEKRQDGYHNLQTCFYPIGLQDILEIVPSKTLKFTATGIPIPGGQEQNLCIKAYHLLKQDFDKLPPVDIHLHKAIPMGAGLGGGSSDAAHALKLLNELFDLNLSTGRLQEYASQLGADCAFFIANEPTLAYDKGDQFSPIPLDLKGYFLAVVYTGLHVSTAEAYHGITPAQPEVALPEILKKPLTAWKDRLKNDFEPSVFSIYPDLKALKNQLYDMGAAYAAMSGSGSAIYGIFGQEVGLSGQFPDDYITWQGALTY